MTTNYKYFIFLLPVLIVSNFYAQNIVPNGSFERFTTCPGGAAFYKLPPWCGLAGGEDSYNVCFNLIGGPGSVGVPYGSQ